MNLKYIFNPFCLIFLSLLGCKNDEDSSTSLIRDELRTNYLEHSVEFDYLKTVTNSKYLKQIVIKAENEFSLSYSNTENDGKERWITISNFNKSNEASSYLTLNDLPKNEVMEIAMALRKINCIRLVENDLFDRNKGVVTKALDLLYNKESDGSSIYYRIFNSPLDSSSKLFSYELIAGQRGEIINQYVLWYKR